MSIGKMAAACMLSLLLGGPALAATPTPTPRPGCGYVEITPAAADDAETQEADYSEQPFTTTATVITMGKYMIDVGYWDQVIVKTGHFRFYTGMLGNSVPVRADLDLSTTAVNNFAGSRTLIGQWVDGNHAWSNRDFVETVGGTRSDDAIVPGLPVASITVEANYFTVPLTNLGNIDRTGYTGLILGISGGPRLPLQAATDSAFVNAASVDHPTAPPPRLRLYMCPWP